MRLYLKSASIAVLLMLLGLRVASPHPNQIPIRPGNSGDFWIGATGDYPKNPIRGFLPYAFPVDGWFLYAAGHMHGYDYYRVPEAEVLAEFPEVLKRLKQPDKKLLDWTQAGLQNWEKADPQRTDARLLILNLKEARLKWRIAKHQEGIIRTGLDSDDFDFAIAWQRMEMFPLLQLAEWCYLSGMILFAAWPWLRNRGRWNWAIHIALVPPLLMLPYYLGYCGWFFTSAGSDGGIIYPYVLYSFQGLPWTSLDTSTIQIVPQILAPLTGPLGQMMGLSYRVAPGPVSVVGLGAGLGAILIGFTYLLRLIRNYRSRS